MVNCLSKRKFSNLLFLDLRVAGADITALFDTGAGMTVITRSAAERLGARMEQATLPAGNNSGLVRRLQTAVLSDVRLGDIPAGELRVVVTDDADLDLRDEIGAAFPAQMLLGWDVISRYRWSYSAKEETLSVGRSETPSDPTDPDSRLGPVVFPSYAGRPFPARVDTGHTSSTLSGAWRARLPNVDWHEAEIVGVGSVRRQSVPYVRELPLLFQGRRICLRDVDISETLYGQPPEIEALLGYDFLAGGDWRLDREFQLSDGQIS